MNVNTNLGKRLISHPLFTQIYTLSNFDLCYTTGIHIKISHFFVSDTLPHDTFKCLRSVLKLLFLHPLDILFSSTELLLKTKKKSVIWASVELQWRCRRLTWSMVSLGWNQFLINAFSPFWEIRSSFFLLPYSTMFLVGLCNTELTPSSEEPHKMLLQAQRNCFVQSPQILFTWVLSTMALRPSLNGFDLSLNSV